MYLDALELCLRDPQAAAAKIVALEERIRSLEEKDRVREKQLLDLASQIQHLTLQKAKNSKNSSKPPSTDGFKKPKPKSRRQKTGRKSGGQKGHKGSTLKPSDTPDIIKDHRVTECECCNKSLADQIPDEVAKRQVFDIPRTPVFVTEHRSEEKTCSYGHLNKAGFPEGVNAPVQYGELIQAVAVYLNVYQMIPYKRTCEVLSDLLGCEMSEGTLHNLLEKYNERIKEPLESIRENIRKATVAHFDETGFQVGSTRWWLHVASTPQATYYRRSKEMRLFLPFERKGLLPFGRTQLTGGEHLSSYKTSCI